jgi:hypothetical protein
MTVPGEFFLGADPVPVDLPRIELVVVNSGDRPVQVGSHDHFAAANPALLFDRSAADGMRLAVPAGTTGARAVGSLLVAGPDGLPDGADAGERPGLRWAWSELNGPDALLLAVGDPGPVGALLDHVASSVPLGAQPPR